MNTKALCIAFSMVVITSGLFYIVTDATTSLFALAVAVWIAIKLPSWPFLAISSISFVIAFIALHIPQITFTPLITPLPYYFLVAYLASETSAYIREQKTQ